MDEEKEFKPSRSDNVKSFLQKIERQWNALAGKMGSLGTRNKILLTPLQTKVLLTLSFVVFLILVVCLFQTLSRSSRNNAILEKMALLETLGEGLDYSSIGAEELFADELRVLEKFER